MTQLNLLELAKQGDAKAITALMNRQLQPKGITAKAALKDSSLQIMLESDQVPDQQALIAWVRKSLKSMGSKSIKRVKVYGRQTGEEFPAWSQEFKLVPQIPPTSIPNSLSSNRLNTNIRVNNSCAQIKKLNDNINADDYRVVGEKNVLYGSLIILGFIFFILLKISLALVVVMLAASAFWVKIHQSQLFGRGVKVSEKQLPEVYRASKLASERLSMRMPDVFVIQSPIINAYAIGFIGDEKTVVLHSALVEAMDEDELISIIGHEFSHIKCNHTNWLVLTNTAENVVKIPIVSPITGFVFLLWSRKCEYTCDRGAMLASQNLKASISALAKLAVGKQLFEKMNIDVLLEQKKDIDSREVSRVSEFFETHPHTINRIHEMKKFYESNLYKKLTAG